MEGLDRERVNRKPKKPHGVISAGTVALRFRRVGSVAREVLESV